MRRRGFSLLELVLVVVIIGLLVAFSLDRLRGLRAEAEKASVEQVLGGLRSAVSIHLLALLVQGRDEELAELQDGNPMDYLAEAPSSYLGSLEHAAPESIARGSWYFDFDERLLVYRVRYGRHFETSLGGPPRARFRLALLYDDRNGNGAFDPGLDGAGGAQIVAEEPYAWLDPFRGEEKK